MKLGFVSAILDGWTFEEMIDTASEMGFSCVEVACWPQGRAERRYAGVSHIDVDSLSDEKAAYILNYCKERKVEISSARSKIPRTALCACRSPTRCTPGADRRSACALTHPVRRACSGRSACI